MLQIVGRRAFGAVAAVFGLVVVLGAYVVNAHFDEYGLGRQISLVLSDVLLAP